MKTERQQDQDVAERLRRENLERVEAGGCAPPVLASSGPKDNEVDEKVMPVAWRYWNATPASHVNILGPGQYEYIDAGKWHPDRAEPLYSAATVTELRDQLERAMAYAAHQEEVVAARNLDWYTEKQRADAAERRVGELVDALKNLDRYRLISFTSVSEFDPAMAERFAATWIDAMNSATLTGADPT